MGITKHEESDGAKAVRGFAKLLAVIIVLAVAGFGDIMYIVEVQRLFAGQGILLVFCYLGAATSFLSVGYLLLGKSAVFRPGGQMLAAWIVFAVEMAVIAMNIMLVFSNNPTGFLAAWAYISPATPVIHMFGVAIIYFLDPELKEKHKDMEVAAKIAAAEREYDRKVAMARVMVMEKQLEHTVRGLAAAANSEATIAALEQHAESLNNSILTDVSGRVPSARNSRNERGYGSRY